MTIFDDIDYLIDVINDGDDDDVLLIVADALEEKGDLPLSTGIRKLVKTGSKPDGNIWHRRPRLIPMFPRYESMLSKEHYSAVCALMRVIGIGTGQSGYMQGIYGTYRCCEGSDSDTLTFQSRADAYFAYAEVLGREATSNTPDDS